VAVQFSLWALPALSAAGIAGAAARYLWVQRRDPGGVALILLAVCAAAWSLLEAVSLLFTGVEAKLFLAQLMYVPISLAPLCWMAFAIGYSGRGRVLDRWPMLSIYAIPLATIVLAFTNASHGLLWADVRVGPVEGLQVMSVEHGFWFLVHSGYAYALTFAATVTLGLHIAQSPRHWWRLIPVFAAPFAVLALNAMYLAEMFGPSAPDPTSFGLSVATAVLAGGLMRRGSVDYAPVARSTVVEEMQDAVIVVDRSGRCVDANEVAREQFGVRPEAEMPIELSVEWAGLRDIQGKRARPEQAIQLTTHGSTQRRWFDMTVSRLGPLGGRDRSVIVLRDVTELVEMRRQLQKSEEQLLEMNEQLKRLANTDELTGLPNRRSFFTALERELGRSDRYDQPLSVVLLDLDHFKRVNDTWGHPVGDRVLEAAAEAVRGVCRDSDVPGRLGGEEFGVLLLHTGKIEAELVAERIRRRIAEVEHLVPGDHLQVTASFGVATTGPGRMDSATIIAAADTALYEAKNAGRNRIAVARDTEEQTAIDFGG
jgi:diguanylate cyclase (GGDEF)-like protein/PAS domain S-box-containing protein